MALGRVQGKVMPAKINELIGDLELGPVLRTYTVATLPAAAANNRRVVHCSNGAAGAPCLAVSNGTNWVRVVFGAAVSATV